MDHDHIIERYQAFWQQYAAEANFIAMSKVLRGLLGYCKAQYGDVSDQVELITEYAEELERFLPLMDLDEFVSSSKSVTYAKRTIKNSGTIAYGSGLARDITIDEERLIRESRAQGRTNVADDRSQGDNTLIDDIRVESSDD